MDPIDILRSVVKDKVNKEFAELTKEDWDIIIPEFKIKYKEIIKY